MKKKEVLNFNYQIQLRKEIAKAGNFSYVGLPTNKKTLRVLNEFGYWLLVDLSGRPLTKAVDRLTAFSQGRAIVEDGKAYHQCDTYFIDEEGNRITNSPIYPHSKYSEGLGVVTNAKNKFGYANKQGKLVIPCSFDYACEFSDSVAWVKSTHYSLIDSLFYLIDKKGNQIIPYPFQAIHNFVNGVAGVKLFEDYFNPKMRPKNCLPSYVVIDKEGNILSGRFLYIEEFCGDIAVASSENYKQIFINKEGKQVSRKAYDSLFIHEGICCASLDNKSFYIDLEENQICQPYDHTTNFSEGLGCVGKKGKFFFIDRTGKEAFSQVFDEAKPFSEGVAKVIKNHQTFYIDHRGEKVF